MILLDTCVMVFDALAPDQLSRKAVAHLETGKVAGELACSGISLWEIGMLISKGRIGISMSPRQFLADVVAANRLQVLPVNAEIAFHATHHAAFTHGDPADRIIAATALHHKATLLTCDVKLRAIKTLKTIW